MTDSNFCCLCASDEGVFLDIFTPTDRQLGNRSFLKEFETCFSFKVNRDEALSTKICHRCAIELGQCNQFVEKYNRVYKATLKQQRRPSKKTCCLCLSIETNNYLFTLAKDFRSTIDPLQKIYECFNRQITRADAESRSICLLCRYNLDVLFDLKKLASEVTTKLRKISESQAIVANLPKTETFVVNRKTTIIPKPKVELETLTESNGKCNTMARKRSRTKKPVDIKPPAKLQFRTCGHCHSSIESGMDMYRLHSTGTTVCKMCWITMDPFNPKSDKRKRRNETQAKNTRLCTVFLQDVLNPVSSENDGLSKTIKPPPEDEIFIISDDSSDNKKEADVKPKRKARYLHSYNFDEDTEQDSRQGLKRRLKSEEPAQGVSGLNKKMKSIKTEATNVSSSLRRSTRYQDLDSANLEGRINELEDRNGVVNKGKSLAKVIDVRAGAKQSTKIKSNKNGKRKEANTKTVESKTEDSASSSESGDRRKTRKVRNKVPLILEPKLPDIQKSQQNRNRAKVRPTVSNKSPTVSKNSRLKSSATSPPTEIKPSPKKSNTVMTVSFPFILRDPYECKVCKTEYMNKILGMKHELTHFKQAVIKVEKLNIAHHFQTDNQNSSTSDLPDASCSVDLTSTNEESPQPEVSISTTHPENDEDQNEAVSDGETEKVERVQQSVSSELPHPDERTLNTDNVKEIDPDVSFSDGHRTEESTPVVNDSTNETTEDIPELCPETSDELKEVDTTSCENNSTTKTNIINGDDTIVISNATIDENKEDELTEELKETTIEERKDAEKNLDDEVESHERKDAEKNSDEEVESKERKDAEKKSDEKVGSEERKDAEKNSDEEVESEGRKDAETNLDEKVESEERKDAKKNSDDEVESEERKDAEKNSDEEVESEERKDAEKNSDEEVESTSLKTVTSRDIEIEKDLSDILETHTDTGITESRNTAEDSTEHNEKCIDGMQLENSVQSEKDTGDKFIDTQEPLKPDEESGDGSNDKADEDIASTTNLNDKYNTGSKTNGVCLEKDQENDMGSKASEASEKMEEDIRPPSASGENLQEVMDLATAEVQKRVECDFTSIPETLENISREIKKTADRSSDIDGISSRINSTSETELSKLDLNSTTDLSNYHLHDGAEDA